MLVIFFVFIYHLTWELLHNIPLYLYLLNVNVHMFNIIVVNMNMNVTIPGIVITTIYEINVRRFNISIDILASAVCVCKVIILSYVSSSKKISFGK